MADDQDPAPVPAGQGGQDRSTKSDRDFGDSAGYGSGGSTRDFHEVGDVEGDPVKGRRNPLDDVVKIKNPVE